MWGRKPAVFSGIRHQLVQHHRQHLRRPHRKHDFRPTDRCVCVRPVGDKLTADKFGEFNAFPVMLAEECMGICHRSYAQSECSNVLLERSVGSVHVLCHFRDACQQLLHARR